MCNLFKNMLMEHTFGETDCRIITSLLQNSKAETHTAIGHSSLRLKHE